MATAVPATRETPEEFRKVIDVNLNGSYWMAQAWGGVMQPGSAIVLGIITGGLPQAAYSASKAGIMVLTRDLAQQWVSRRGIRVNGLAPCFFKSEMTDGYEPGYLETVLPRVFLGRLWGGWAIRLNWPRPPSGWRRPPVDTSPVRPSSPTAA